jgi:hypothetical protein
VDIQNARNRVVIQEWSIKMAKIGRNEKCPCGSGNKFKHCCTLKPQEVVELVSQERQLKLTLTEGVEVIQRLAKDKKNEFREIGVFLFYSTEQGDAWLLEVTESDCVQVANGGKALEMSIDENPETIEIDWSHTFSIVDKKFKITSYLDKEVTELSDAPCQKINAAIKRIYKKLTPEMFEHVHLTEV